MRAPPKRLASFLALFALTVPGAALAQTFDGDFSLSSGAVYQTAFVDEAKAVAVDTITAGGPYIYVTGDSNDAGSTVKLSSAGVALTSAAFFGGGLGAGHGIAVDPSGNPWVVGHSVTGGPLTNWVVKKYNPNLAVTASTVIAGVSLGDAVATSIAFDAAGNAFVAGYSSNTGTGTDYRVVKYSPSLAVLATASFGGTGVDQANALTVDASGNVIVTGYRTPYDFVTVKFSSALVVLSTAVYDAGATDRAYGVTTDPSGNVYVTGESDGGGANFGFTTVKYDPSLVQQGVASHNTPSYDAGFGAVFVGTATLVVIGSSFAGATEDMVILEYDPSLAVVSSRTYDSGTSDRAYGVAKGTGTYLYVTGYSFTSPSGAYRTLRLDSSAPAEAVAPRRPYGFAGAVQSSSSVLWTWTDDAPDETGFRVMVGTVSLSGDLPADTTAWLQTGMPSNTASGAVFAQVFNATGTADSGAASRFTFAAPPTGLTAVGVYQTTATLSWTAENPAGTVFQLERSTGGSFALTASTTAAVYDNTGLGAATTYYYRVRALNADLIASAYSSTISLLTTPATGPAAPSAFAGAAQTTASILWSWSDNSPDETGFRVLSGTVSVSGNLAANATTWLQTGLPTNTAVGPLSVQVFNSTGTADSGAASRFTLAAVPSAPGASSVFQTSATVSWAAGNPAGTVFELERSTGAGFSLLVSSTAAAFVDTGLSAAATFYYRVRAINGDLTATAYASSITVVTEPVPQPGAPTGFAGAAQSASAVLWTWADNAFNEDGYRVLSGTVSLSGDLAAGVTGWLQTGLAANTAYGPYHAQAFNAGGTSSSTVASRTTWAATPSGLAAPAVALTSATVVWSAAGNPAGTTFELERSTGAGYGLQASGPATYYLDAGLTPSATFYYRVRAVNAEAVATAYSSTLAVVAWPLPPVPASPGAPAGSALGTSSITWTWSLASGASSYSLFRAADGAYRGSASSSTFTESGLAPNAAYGLRAAGVNIAGTGPLSAAATAYTLAAEPAGTGTAVTSTTIVASWTLNGNPASTVAELLRSTDAVAYSTMTVGAVTSHAEADLLGCTTYYYRVRNLNGDGVPTAYASFSGVTANTVPSPPSGLTAGANAGGTVGLSWALSPTEGVTGYRLYWDAGTGTVSYGAPIAVLGSTATAFTTGVLTSSASYTFALRAAHRCGTVETAGAVAMSGAAVAPPAVRAAVKEPDSGRRISGDRVTVLGELVYGTPSDVQQVLFQYKLASSTAWLSVPAANVNHSNPDLDSPYFVHWDVTVLAAGSYDVRAVAYDRTGVPDPAPPAVRVVVDPVAPDIREALTVGGQIKKDQTISNLATSVVETAGAGASDPAVRVTLPPGVVNATTATVSVIANPSITTAPPSGQTMVGSAIKIDLSNGQTALNGVAAITLTYPDTIRFPSLLQIYYLDEATGRWSRDFTTTVNASSRTVTGSTPHFSTFVLMLGTAFAPNLDSVQAYPVPYKPNGANPDEGRPFSHGDPNSGILFANLAPASEIRIYTMSGRLVSSLDNPTIAGTVRWDARNQDGREVASGAYFAVISAPGQKSVIKKLVIIR